MRASLADLRATQARLEQEAKAAREAEEALTGELRSVLKQGVELQREDMEHLIYTDEGWGPWEDEFRAAWNPFQPEPSFHEQSPITGASSARRRSLRRQALLGAESQCDVGREAYLISDRPLLVAIPDFASPEECAELIELGFRTCKPHNKWAQEVQRPGMQRAKGASGPVRGVATASMTASELPDGPGREALRRLQRRVAALTGIPEHGDEIRPFLKFDHPGEGRRDRHGPGKSDLSIGLHIDTNGGFKHCACSVILYLNSCEGGQTVFPCVGDERSQALGVQLAAGHTHTSHNGVFEAGLGPAAAELVERAELAPGALRVSPRRGMAVLFFSLLGEVGARGAGTVDGGAADAAAAAPAPDPWSWHGGAAVCGSIGKWTLQIFKEVPLGRRGGPPEAAFVDSLRRRVLEAAGQSGAEGEVHRPPICLSAMD